MSNDTVKYDVFKRISTVINGWSLTAGASSFQRWPPGTDAILPQWHQPAAKMPVPSASFVEAHNGKEHFDTCPPRWL